ncbi:ABC transporter ATP-binding protein [Ponticaulis sp.]|uniref:ABC transporter ATP-binding protein n=1 Tax=Ponticaulis sp. TaxID=2020902 RepID=UPI000B6C54E4|nr:ABC transporter ATP-binding protein [Ponticaulis sp.]MAJ07773.1 ABC transporter [Ponticaulis sp.]RPG18094.1 MAG: ABC transporter ATP-binding protein [Hyphomonadaceae bacterium TMED125]HBH90851.1 ABC transporter [Hyphomonadaceae bacterium]
MAESLNLHDVRLTLPAQSGPVEILKGVSLKVEPGECVAVIGPSGSGKSSLISIAAGLERITSGKVELLGTDITGMSEDALARLRRGRVSLIFQSYHLLPTMTALDNVRVPLEISGIEGVKDKATKLLQEVGLGDRLDHYPGQMSGGERQRVAVARALASDPEIVFADEPTGNLDGDTGAGVANMLFDIVQKRKAAMVLVTHDRELAKRADRIVTMRNGNLEA